MQIMKNKVTRVYETPRVLRPPYRVAGDKQEVLIGLCH